MALLPYLQQVTTGKSLAFDDAHQAMITILDGGVPDAVLAGFLVALKMKGETADELAGFARAMREKCVRVETGDDISNDVIDIVGTGGDDAGTFNISTVAAMVLAGAGAKVAKHGNRAISGKVGSADVLEALGVRIAMSADEAARAVREIGLGFLFAPHLHPAMKHAQNVRRELKLRTVFNLLGPLANPAGAKRQLIGAPSADAAKIMAEALQILGTEHSFVVHGVAGGLDEVSSIGSTEGYEVRSTGITKYTVAKHTWLPEDFGIARASLDSLAGGDAAVNAKITVDILRGELGPKRDIVLLNAAVGLMVAGLADSPKAGIVLAAQAIDSRKALGILEKLRKNFPAA